MCLTDFKDCRMYCRYIAHGWYFRLSCELLPPWTKKLKTRNPKCRLYWCLIEFIDRRCSQSCWYFRPSFVNYWPANLLSGSPPAPLPKDIIYRQCGAGGWCWDHILQEFNTLFLARFRTYKIALRPQTQKSRRGGGRRQINTCRKSLYR